MSGNHETLEQKTRRLRAAAAAGFPSETLIQLMTEVVAAMADQQIEHTRLVVSEMQACRQQIDALVAEWKQKL